MITYVNTVLVSNLTSGNVLSAAPASADNMNTPSDDAGKFVVMTMDEKPAKITKTKIADSSTEQVDDDLFPFIGTKATAGGYTFESNAAKYNTIRVGIVTKKNAPKVNPATGATTYEPIIKWSNKIAVGEVKSYNEHTYNSGTDADTEDTAYINFRQLDSTLLSNTLSNRGKRIIVRLTFKDLPTRFRKWTESYEYVTADGDTANSIVKNIVNMINKEYKRARVVASLGTASAGSNTGDPDTIAATASGSESGANTVVLTALPYDDDNSVDSLNWANKVRFNVNIYYTDPAKDGFESTNKYFPKGVVITKVPGQTYKASAKLVRDREAQAMGYQGILNRGEGVWPVIKPEMETNLGNTYDAITLEFERTYRTADDLFRKTKECVEIYANHSAGISDISAILKAFIG